MFSIYAMSTFTQIYGIIHLTYSSIVYNFSRFTTGNLASVVENHGKRYRMPMESTCPAWAQARQTVKPTQFPLFFPGPSIWQGEFAWTCLNNKILFQKIWFCPLPHPVDSIEGPLLAVFPQKNMATPINLGRLPDSSISMINGNCYFWVANLKAIVFKWWSQPKERRLYHPYTKKGYIRIYTCIIYII